MRTKLTSIESIGSSLILDFSRGRFRLRLICSVPDISFSVFRLCELCDIFIDGYIHSSITDAFKVFNSRVWCSFYFYEGLKLVSSFDNF